MPDHPYPGARACPVCWDDHPAGRFTATHNGVTHRSQACGLLCMKMGVGDWNIDLHAERLRDVKGRLEAVQLEGIQS